MKKWLILGGVVMLVVLLNLGYWFWFQSNSSVDSLEATEKGLIKAGWRKFVETNVVEFDVPAKFKQETNISGIYWLDPTKAKIVIVYETFPRSLTLNLKDQVTKKINVVECAGEIEKNDLMIYKECPYMNSYYSFVAFQQKDNISIISFDHQYFSEEDINYLINSVEKL